jgi:hypothetical protein
VIALVCLLFATTIIEFGCCAYLYSAYKQALELAYHGVDK